MMIMSCVLELFRMGIFFTNFSNIIPLFYTISAECWGYWKIDPYEAFGWQKGDGFDHYHHVVISLVFHVPFGQMRNFAHTIRSSEIQKMTLTLDVERIEWHLFVLCLGCCVGSGIAVTLGFPGSHIKLSQSLTFCFVHGV